jgi:hypothetical protein
VKYIDPKYDTTKYTPLHFYIAAVVDKTGTADSIGFSLQPRSVKPQKVSLKEGTVTFFKKYTGNLLKADSSLYPVLLVISELSLADERYKNVGDETTLKYKLEVHSLYKNDTFEVTHYFGQQRFRTTLGDKKKYDSMFLGLSTFWPHVDEVFKELLDKHRTFCKGVKLNINVRSQASNADSLFYNGQRLLTWDDYRGEAEKKDAILSYIFINYDANSSYDKGYVIVDVDLETVFSRTDSWVHGGMETTNVLNHDNYKFRLAYLHMLRLKKELETIGLTYDNYKTEIPAMYRKNQKEANAAFNAYDKETAYGARKKEQLRWQQTIDDDIAGLE